MSQQSNTALDEQAVKGLLEQVPDPATSIGLDSAGVVRGIGIDGDRVSVSLRLGYPADRVIESLTSAVREKLLADPRIGQAQVEADWRVQAHRVQPTLNPIDGIRNIIVVASAKGGVGKSTTAVNMAVALRQLGARVGLLDADIYGPSQPGMLGLSGKPEVTADKQIIPKEACGMPVMSMGFLVEDDTAMIWRGPMVTSALQQMLSETAWPELDYLVVDLPPGTGDIQLTLAQKIPVAGAVLVTTPQDIALLDAVRGLMMFRRVEVPVLGLVENMSSHVCSACGHEEAIFGHLGGSRMAEKYDVRLLGQLPLDIRIREQSDNGVPVTESDAESELAGRYRDLALRTAGVLAQQPRSRHVPMPGVVMQNG